MAVNNPKVMPVIKPPASKINPVMINNSPLNRMNSIRLGLFFESNDTKDKPNKHHKNNGV